MTEFLKIALIAIVAVFLAKFLASKVSALSFLRTL